MKKLEVPGDPKTLSKIESNERSAKIAGEKKECFIIMPISDQNGYPLGHFTKVYEQIIKPAVEAAGYISIRADEVTNTHLIHKTIIEKLINAPMAICDLSSKNANVMFELGIRQAYDKPVVLLQDERTPPTFDVGGLNTIFYESSREYENVLQSRIKIADAIEGNQVSCDSIMSLLMLSAAKLSIKPQNTDDKIDMLLGIVSDLGARMNYVNNVLKNSSYDSLNESISKQIIAIKERVLPIRSGFLKNTINFSKVNNLYKDLDRSIYESEELRKVLIDLQMEMDHILGYNISSGDIAYSKVIEPKG